MVDKVVSNSLLNNYVTSETDKVLEGSKEIISDIDLESRTDSE